MTEKTDPPPAEDEPQIRPFSEVLVQQARGRTHDDLSVGLHNLIAAVQETGKGGKLQLTVDVKPLKGDTNTLQVVATVTSKVPQVDQPASIFFVDDDGNLTRKPRKGFPSLPQVVVTVTGEEGTFPKWDSLIEGASKTTDLKPAYTAGDEVGFNPELLARLGRAKTSAHKTTAVLKMKVHSVGLPLVATLGDDFTGIVMPMRIADAATVTAKKADAA